MSDLEEMVRTRRIEQIFETRRRVHEDRRSIREARQMGQIDKTAANRLYKNAVDDHVRTLEVLLNPPDSDETSDYWDSEPIGQIEFPGKRARVVEGLGEYLALPDVIEVEVATTHRDHYYQLGDETAEIRRVQPPRRIANSALSVADKAKAQLGLELEIGDERDGEIKWAHLVSADGAADNADTNGHSESEIDVKS